MLVLPRRLARESSGARTLPEYAAQPHYLSPSHCRLCLQPFSPGLEEVHLQECGQCTKAEYRHRVFRSVLAEWPQPIPAQVLRTRLAAFKEELCDGNFQEMPCASCCRLKRRCKLLRVCFPAGGVGRVRVCALVSWCFATQRRQRQTCTYARTLWGQGWRLPDNESTSIA